MIRNYKKKLSRFLRYQLEILEMITTLTKFNNSGASDHIPCKAKWKNSGVGDTIS